MSAIPNRTPTLYIEGPAFWAPTLPGWDIARAAFTGQGAPVDPPAKRPSPQVLAPAERRRAPDTVALSLEVAAQAIAASGREARDLPCVFASAHGDLGINDYMCGTLANDPTLLSPIKFHNSVHNAAAGYWTIGAGAMAPATALSASRASFAQGLLEALAQLACGAEAVLLVGYDSRSVGALGRISHSEGLLGGALVLGRAPQAGRPRLRAHLRDGEDVVHAGPLQRHAAANAMAPMLPLFDLLAGAPGPVSLHAGAGRQLVVEREPQA